MSAGKILICFAVKEEAAVFRRSPTATRVNVLLTGMGRANAQKTIRAAIAADRPSLVITSGCAGGLDPQLITGDVIFSTGDSVAADISSRQLTGLKAKLVAGGAREGRFHFADRVATTASEKSVLRQQTSADAVEMESQVIREICRAEGIPSVTVRVILDTADENLPLDFNVLMTPDMRLDFGKLALTILKSPGKIGALLHLQKQTKFVAAKLSEVLSAMVG